MEMSVAVARNKGITSKNIGNEKPLTSISWLRTFIFSLYSNSCKKKCWPPLFFSHTLSFYSHSSPFLSLDHSTELQATICFHRYPASFAQHCKRLLEAGPGLPLHIYSNAEWRGSCPGTVCVWFGFFYISLSLPLCLAHMSGLLSSHYGNAAGYPGDKLVRIKAQTRPTLNPHCTVRESLLVSTPTAAWKLIPIKRL